MKPPSASPKVPRSRKPKPGVLTLITNDADIVRGLRFIKKLLVNTVVTVLSFAIVSTGGYVIALIISQIGKALTSRRIELPEWTHKSEAWSVGIFLVLMMILATWLIIKDIWIVGAQMETEDKRTSNAEEEKK